MTGGRSRCRRRLRCDSAREISKLEVLYDVYSVANNYIECVCVPIRIAVRNVRILRRMCFGLRPSHPAV
jgi:hypothetical protein